MALFLETKADFDTAMARINGLIVSDPAQAVSAARELRGKGNLKYVVLGLRGATLVDAGGAIRDGSAVVEGVRIFRRLINKDSSEPTFQYNLANGLSKLADLTPHTGPEWYVRTSEQRREARRTFHALQNESVPLELRARGLINLGNEMDRGYRWVEAYDRWVEALSLDPSNPVATLSAARMLLRRITYHGHTRALHRIAGYYARIAARNALGIEAIAGRGAANLLQSLPTFRGRWRPRTLHEIKDNFGRFVAQHRLGLVGTVEGLDLRRKRWDDALPAGISEPLNTDFGVPPIFAMINQLKADFCAARWLAYISRKHSVRDTAIYIDTLDYALYSVNQSLSVLAQRAALDVLDRIAVCANEYFKVGDKPTAVYFRPFWRHNGGTGEWRESLLSELTTGNPGLVALGELALDLCDGGMLASKHDLRNVSTHRFAVLHDIGRSPSRPSSAIEHYEEESFFDETIATLQVVRSAFLYLLDAIEISEGRSGRHGRRAPFPLTPHHVVRGE